MASLAKALVLILLANMLNAHEHWLFTDSSEYVSGDSVSIHLRSGHTADQSEFLIDTKLIQEAFMIGPYGERQDMEFKVEGNEHISSILVREPGTYTILTNLRKRSKGPFTYLLKTQIQVGPIARDSNYSAVQELEIIPGESPNSLQVTASGAHVNVPLVLMSRGKSGHSLTMDRNGVSSFSGDSPGFSVVVCQFRRQSASYSFYNGN